MQNCSDYRYTSGQKSQYKVEYLRILYKVTNLRLSSMYIRYCIKFTGLLLLSNSRYYFSFFFSLSSLYFRLTKASKILSKATEILLAFYLNTLKTTWLVKIIPKIYLNMYERRIQVLTDQFQRIKLKNYSLLKQYNLMYDYYLYIAIAAKN